MEIRSNTDMNGAQILDIDTGRIIYLATSFVAEDDDGLVVTGRLAATFEDDQLVIGLQDVSLRMDPDAGITPGRLRRIPWSKILDQVLDSGAVPITDMGGGRFVVDSERQVPGDADIRRTRQGGRRRLDDDHYRHVAAIYRRALTRGGDPVVAVQVETGRSRPTAGEYVAEARRRGFLGPAPARGKKGERS